MILPPLLIDAAKRKNLIPLVGAGVSMSLKTASGERAYPSWPEVLERAAVQLEDMGKHKESKAISALLSINMYQPAADIAKKELIGSQWGDFLRNCFDIGLDEIDSDSVNLPVALWKISKK